MFVHILILAPEAPILVAAYATNEFAKKFSILALQWTASYKVS